MCFVEAYWSLRFSVPIFVFWILTLMYSKADHHYWECANYFRVRFCLWVNAYLYLFPAPPDDCFYLNILYYYRDPIYMLDCLYVFVHMDCCFIISQHGMWNEFLLVGMVTTQQWHIEREKCAPMVGCEY